MPRLATTQQNLNVPLRSLGGAGGSPFLTDYPGATAAYSLRDLAGTNPNVVRVRRSSDNTEQDFTAPQITDGTLTTFTGAGDGFVATWYDQTANANNATQATQANQPQIVSSGSLLTFGSNPGVFWGDGTARALRASWTSIAGPLTIFSAASVATPSTTRNEYLFDGFTSSTRTVVGNLSIGGSEYKIWILYSTGRNGEASAFSESNTSILFTALYRSVNSKLRRNGVETISGTDTGAINSDGISIGHYLSNGDYNWNDKIFELIVYPSDKTAEFAGIESAINTHYSIY